MKKVRFVVDRSPEMPGRYVRAYDLDVPIPEWCEEIEVVGAVEAPEDEVELCDYFAGHRGGLRRLCIHVKGHDGKHRFEWNQK